MSSVEQRRAAKKSPATAPANETRPMKEKSVVPPPVAGDVATGTSKQQKGAAREGTAAPPPRRKRAHPMIALSIIAVCVAFIYYVVVELKGNVTGQPKRFQHSRSLVSDDVIPTVTDEQWSLLLAPQYTYASSSSGDAAPLLNARAASGVIRTKRLPQLYSMLTHRLKGTSANSNSGLERIGGDFAGSVGVGASAATIASRLNVVLDEMAMLLRTYEIKEIEDAEAITDHYWPSLTAVSSSSGSGGVAAAKQKKLPHDVMLLGEWASILASGLRNSLLNATTAEDAEEKDSSNAGDEGKRGSGPSSPSVAHLPSLTKDQQLMTLCYAESDVLPRYYLLVEDARSHMNSLMDAIECLRILRDNIVGTVVPATHYVKKMRAAAGGGAAAIGSGSPRGGLFGKSRDVQQQQQEREEKAKAALALAGDGSLDAASPSSGASAYPAGTAVYTSHARLTGELAKLVTDKAVTRAIVMEMIGAFAHGQLCAANATMADSYDPIRNVYSRSEESDASDAHRLSQSRCTQRLAALSYPSGIDTKIGSLLEEGIAMDAQFVPLRVMYLAHVALGMGRCGRNTIESLNKEMKAQRVMLSPTPVYRQWLQGIKDVCLHGKDGGPSRLRRAGGGDGDDEEDLGLIDTAGLDGDDGSDVFLADHREEELKARFPLAIADDVAQTFKGRGLAPRQLMGEREYRRFVRLAKSIH